MAANEHTCTYNYNGDKCRQKIECPICKQCGDGDNKGHCPGHRSLHESFLPKKQKAPVKEGK